MLRAAVDEVAADGDHDQGRGGAVGSGRRARGRVESGDERVPFHLGPFAPLVRDVQGEQLLELVDGQDQPGSGHGRAGQAAPPRVGVERLAYQEVRLTGLPRERAQDAGSVQARQPGHQDRQALQRRSGGPVEDMARPLPGRLRQLAAPGRRQQPRAQQGRLARPGRAGHDQRPGAGQALREPGHQLRRDRLPPVEHPGVRFGEGDQPPVRAPVGPRRPRLRRTTRAGPPLDRRHLLQEQPRIGGLPVPQVHGELELGALPPEPAALAVDALADEPQLNPQLGQDEPEFAELLAHRRQPGGQLRLQPAVTGPQHRLDRGADRPDLPQQLRDLAAQPFRPLPAGLQDPLDAPLQLRLQVPLRALDVRAAQPRDPRLHQIGQDVPADRRHRPDSRRGHRRRPDDRDQQRPDRARRQHRQQHRSGPPPRLRPGRPRPSDHPGPHSGPHQLRSITLRVLAHTPIPVHRARQGAANTVIDQKVTRGGARIRPGASS
ncbi:hypothetical protein LUX39_48280 [Actinomadura madurae]|nr:hypothetical protein [Actinomadura madurae]MCQ0020504.1 hypothetical protein [Actinomadura madurae]